MAWHSRPCLPVSAHPCCAFCDPSSLLITECPHISVVHSYFYGFACMGMALPTPSVTSPGKSARMPSTGHAPSLLFPLFLLAGDPHLTCQVSELSGFRQYHCSLSAPQPPEPCQQSTQKVHGNSSDQTLATPPPLPEVSAILACGRPTSAMAQGSLSPRRASAIRAPSRQTR